MHTYTCHFTLTCVNVSMHLEPIPWKCGPLETWTCTPIQMVFVYTGQNKDSYTKKFLNCFLNKALPLMHLWNDWNVFILSHAALAMTISGGCVFFNVFGKSTLTQQFDAATFLCLYRCFLLSPTNSCLVSRTHAGMRSTLGISLRTLTGQTCMHAIRGASGPCFSTWGTLSESTCFIMMGNSTACGAFLISISLANQSVARQTCMTDWGCIRMSSSPLSKSHTGGPARGLVSKENYTLPR